ncbi:MAG: serine hydrolase [Desulfobacteraceae bacterium]|nr:serine hydrolase [Desulfobacteraceae bacterium]
MSQINDLMIKGVKDKVFPGGVLLVSKNDSIIFFEAYGYANIFSKRIMTKNTIFDLASLTKPLATTLAVMKLIQQGKLDLEQNLGTVLPEFRDTDKKQIAIRNLLCHNSGLSDYRPYYIELLKIPYNLRKKALKQFLINEPIVYPTGKNVLYSDLGFMILGWIVEKVSGRSLDYFVFKDIYKPLGLKDLFFVNLASERHMGYFAATELCPWRKILLDGLVHDDNAYVIGGIAGHAGLFGTAMDVNVLLFSLLSALHEHSYNFKRDLINKFFERQKDSDRTLGFDTPSSLDSSCGSLFSKRSIGHLGFTGTSFWMDLDRSIIVILLTNRIHPSRDNNKIKKFRPILHDTVMDIIL